MRIYAVTQSDGWQWEYLAYFSTARKAIKYRQKVETCEDNCYGYSYKVVVVEVDQHRVEGVE